MPCFSRYDEFQLFWHFLESPAEERTNRAVSICLTKGRVRKLENMAAKLASRKSILILFS